MSRSDNISQFENEMSRIHRIGHILSVQHLPRRAGVELTLPASISLHQATAIASFITKQYGLKALFFIKKHNITVYYEG